MNYNFTNSTRLVLNRAHDEAIALRHGYIGVEHILLGLLGDQGVVALLGTLGTTTDAIRAAVIANCRTGDFKPGGEISYTMNAREIIELAMSEARDRNASEVNCEHMFIAILRLERGIGAYILRDLGITLDNGQPVRSLRVRIDGASDRSIYEQIVAQITEWIATGVLRSGDRIPTVRRLADDLDVAPGTVAKAYSELERQGLVVTEGARGTRVADRVATPDPFLDRPGMLVGLLRPVAVAAFHLGATAAEVRSAMDDAMKGIFDRQDPGL